MKRHIDFPYIPSSAKEFCYKLFLLTIFFQLLVSNVIAQKQPLTASSKVVKIAVIDPVRLRKEYKEFANEKEKSAKENENIKKTKDETLRTLEQQVKEELRVDSLSGKGKPGEIVKRAETKRKSILKDFEVAQQQRKERNAVMAKKYEHLIQMAIDQVVAEGGFTDVRLPFKDASSTTRSIEVTNLILKKLNQK